MLAFKVRAVSIVLPQGELAAAARADVQFQAVRVVGKVSFPAPIQRNDAPAFCQHRNLVNAPVEADRAASLVDEAGEQVDPLPFRQPRTELRQLGLLIHGLRNGADDHLRAEIIFVGDLVRLIAGRMVVVHGLY